jgi:mono/diheme cytochrome c family protein/DNA-binding beta-propeller fold protein YncE
LAPKRRPPALAAMFGALAFAAAASVAAAEPAKIYADHCAACHGADRFGGMGPALLPSNLERLRQPLAETVVARGRAATQMPGFADKLSPDEIRQVVDLIYREPSTEPVWGAAQINASRIEYRKAGELPSRPIFSADPLNLFVVVEVADHHVSILDGDRLEPITRFASRYALHGGPKFSPDGRFVYFASRDGWISKYDLWSLSLVSEVRAGLNTRNAAVSADGKYVMVANYLPHSLALLDADLKFVKLIAAADAEGKHSSRVSAVYDAAPRKSFIVAMKDIKELWEVSYDPGAEPVYQGLVHDYRTGEGLAAKGQFTPRRVPLDDFMDDFFFDPSYAHAIGASRNEKGEGSATQVINMFVRRRIATLDLPGMPHLASGISWERNGRTVLATPNLARGVVSVFDAKDWKLVREIPTLGPGFFMRSHENTPYAWVDAMMSPAHKDTLQVFNKQTLEKVAELRPEPGKTLAHVEFTRDGRYALASLWEDDGAIIVFDAVTLKEVKRIPMRKPVGKYNVYNKINRSEGTSH